jgi:hypothetical protein
MRVDERRAKVRELIAQEAQAVHSENLAEYMSMVISAVSILRHVAAEGKIGEMPQEQVTDMIEAAGSTLIFSRELLIQVQRLLESK